MLPFRCQRVNRWASLKLQSSDISIAASQIQGLSCLAFLASAHLLLQLSHQLRPAPVEHILTSSEQTTRSMSFTTRCGMAERHMPCQSNPGTTVRCMLCGLVAHQVWQTIHQMFYQSYTWPTSAGQLGKTADLITHIMVPI